MIKREQCVDRLKQGLGDGSILMLAALALILFAAS